MGEVYKAEGQALRLVTYLELGFVAPAARALA